MSPLADPVVNAIFTDKDNAGLAAESLIKAVLEADGENLQIGGILSVTPQRHHSNVKQRGCRIDVEVATENRERVIFEIQTNEESWIMQRNLFAASHIFTETSTPGHTSYEMARALPKIIVINILTYTIRGDNDEVLQPVKQMFTKPPQRVAVNNFVIYNVQLPMIDKMEADFDNALYCWFYLLHKAESEKKTIKEVIDMTPQLQTYSELDAGFRQFCRQYDKAASDPEVRREYASWFDGLMREAGIKHAAEERVRRESKQEGIVIGEENERKKWQGVVADKDAEIAELRAKLGLDK
jgi:hypothetical protein